MEYARITLGNEIDPNTIDSRASAVEFVHQSLASGRYQPAIAFVASRVPLMRFEDPGSSEYDSNDIALLLTRACANYHCTPQNGLRMMESGLSILYDISVEQVQEIERNLGLRQ